MAQPLPQNGELMFVGEASQGHLSMGGVSESRGRECHTYRRGCGKSCYDEHHFLYGSENVSQCTDPKPHCNTVCDSTCPTIGRHGIGAEVMDGCTTDASCGSNQKCEKYRDSYSVCKFTCNSDGDCNGLKCVDGMCTQRYLNPGSWSHAKCIYSASDFQSEDDVKKWRDNFTTSNAQKTDMINYWCARNNNVKGVQCAEMCNERWNTDQACKDQLEAYCSVGDRALNDDWCFNKCHRPDGDGKPQWCDTVITNVCKLTMPQGSAEGFHGTSNSAVAMALIVAGIIMIYLSWKAI